jgi:hypothetical protein
MDKVMGVSHALFWVDFLVPISLIFGGSGAKVEFIVYPTLTKPGVSSSTVVHLNTFWRHIFVAMYYTTTFREIFRRRLLPVLLHFQFYGAL